VACANFAFFKEFEGTKPDEDCRYNGNEPKKNKAELMKYLRDSFQFADQAIAILNAQNALDKVESNYGGPSTKLGITVLAVWHASDQLWPDRRIPAHEWHCAAGKSPSLRSYSHNSARSRSDTFSRRRISLDDFPETNNSAARGRVL
jgi:hypothetical protein